MTAHAAMTGRNDRFSPNGDQGIEYPMRRAIRDGSEALDDVLPDPEQGTVNDISQGASNGMLDGTQEASDGRATSDGSDAASESGTSAGNSDQKDDKGNGMTTVAIVIACLAAVAIIVLIFFAIPKSKAKGGGPGNKNN